MNEESKAEPESQRLMLPTYQEIKVELEKHFGRPLQRSFSFHLENFWSSQDSRLNIPDEDQLFLNTEKTKFAVISRYREVETQLDQKYSDVLNRDLQYTTSLPVDEKNFVVLSSGSELFLPGELFENIKSYDDYKVNYQVTLDRHNYYLVKTYLEIEAEINAEIEAKAGDYCGFAISWIDLKYKDYIYVAIDMVDDMIYAESIVVQRPPDAILMLNVLNTDYLASMEREQLLDLLLELKRNCREVRMLPRYCYTPPDRPSLCLESVLADTG